MAKYPFLPLWTDAYLGDTTHLTTIEHGAYLLLLMTAWRSKDGLLPNDDVLLARYTKLNKSQWLRIKPILLPFFSIENGYLKQGRLTDELEAVKRRGVVQSNNANARWLKTKETSNATAMPNACQTHANHTHTHTQNNKNNHQHSDENFSEFWSKYPKKVGKADAEKKYKKALSKISHENMMAALDKFIRAKADTEVKFIPHPSTWLFQERFFDDLSTTKKKTTQNNEWMNEYDFTG